MNKPSLLQLTTIGLIMVVTLAATPIPEMKGAPLVTASSSASIPRLSLADWSIPSFEVDVQVQKDGSMLIQERIQADFSKEPHRGIIRNIPVHYSDERGIRSSIAVSDITVTDEKGKSWQYESYKEGDNLNLKIGNPDIYLNTLVTYHIGYKVERGMTFFEDHDEIYFNAIGTGWEAPIEKATTTITLPSAVNPGDLQVACYTGRASSTEQNCTAEIKNGSTLTYSTSQLAPYEGMSVVAGFPKGEFPEPSPAQKAVWFLQENWGFLLPFLTLALLFYLWYTKGRDAQASRTTIMPTYKPSADMTPAEAGTIIDEKVDIRDISSTIIDMAVRGYVKIVEIKQKVLLWDTTDYEFQRVKEYAADPSVKKHERKILDAIFSHGGSSVKLSSLKNVFYKDIPDIQTEIYKSLVQKGYFLVSPESVRKIYAGISFALVFISIFFGLFTLGWLPISVPVGVFFSGAICFLFSFFMPAKTKKGVEAKYEVLGLQEFIQTAEKDRLKFQEKENIFEKLLPYAMAMNVADKWTKAFEGIYTTPPSWYQSSNPAFLTHFSAYQLSQVMNQMTSSMNSTMTSAPRSSGSGLGGGGFSGGGFGGGGGSAW